MSNLPFTIFVGVHVGVASLDLVTRRSHGEFVDSGVHAPVVALNDVRLQNDTLGLFLQKVDKVALDAAVVGTRRVRHGGQQDGRLGVSFGDRVGIESGQRVVPQSKEGLDFAGGNGRSGAAFNLGGSKEGTGCCCLRCS